jgi:hypothetical protein
MVEWFSANIMKEYNIISSIMIITEIFNLIREYMWADGKDKNDLLNILNQGIKNNKIKQYILKESGKEKFDFDTIGSIFLSAYAAFADSYAIFRHCFDLITNDNDFQPDKIDAFLKLYGENTKFQHIDYRLALVEGEFAEIFTIKSSLSLILFETAHILDNNVAILKCKNCGQYFVPIGRSDTIYCSYPSPQDFQRTCKEIGAQVSRSNKEKTDVSTREYRKVYMRYKMMTRRHPEDKVYENKFNQLTSEVKEWRNRLAHGTATTEEFLNWLMDFSDSKEQ